MSLIALTSGLAVLPASRTRP